MLFKVNSILFKVAIVLCIIYCSAIATNAYEKSIDANVIITQASLLNMLDIGGF